MTRINAAIPTEELSNKHLLAEHREIKRIPNAVRTGKALIKDIPQEFTLGKGHVKFFYNKCGFLLDRYKQIYAECKKRGMNVTDYSDAWQGIPKEYMNTWQPTGQANELIRQRIKERTK